MAGAFAFCFRSAVFLFLSGGAVLAGAADRVDDRGRGDRASAERAEFPGDGGVVVAGVMGAAVSEVRDQDRG